MKRILVALIVSLFILAGCGGGESEPADAGIQGLVDEQADWPSCPDVWVDGQSLPDGYDGCRNRVSDYPRTEIECASGSMVYVEFDGRYRWAMLPTPGVIKSYPDGQMSDEYGDDYEAC